MGTVDGTGAVRAGVIWIVDVGGAVVVLGFRVDIRVGEVVVGKAVLGTPVVDTVVGSPVGLVLGSKNGSCVATGD